MPQSQRMETTRRGFLQVSAAALAGAAPLSAGAFAAGDDTLRVGLIGCGGRGAGACAQALQADSRVKLTAMGDVFDDRLQLSLETLKRQEAVAHKIDVPPERQFIGFDAYQQVIDSGVDVVLLTTPPHFRPLHMEAAVKAGVHIFAEKPVAVDAPGVRKVLALCDEARSRGLAIVSGLCLRYDKGFQELTARIHEGAIGEVHTLIANDYRGPIWMKPRQPDWTDMHWQMRNWYYFTWLSGDFNVEQHVHYLDVCAWAMGGYPERAIGMGGRQVRVGEEYGNIYDHFSVCYKYDNGARFFSNTRQQAGCAGDMSAQVLGSRGMAHYSESARRGGLHIRGENPWKYTGKHTFMYQEEHNQLFASIRAGKPLNNGEYQAKSTLLAILGRMAAYTGKEITWEQALNSQEDLTPPRYEWGPLPTPPVAMPGVTPFV